MSAMKDKKTGKWNAYFRYTNWKGERKQKLKRGFPTRREALDWEREFLQQQAADIDMSFASFVELYRRDMQAVSGIIELPTIPKSVVPTERS